MNNLSKAHNTPIYNIDQITDSVIKEKVVVNYDTKTQLMIDNKLQQSDINEFLNFMNYCFLVKNNFFIDNFSAEMIGYVYWTYNKIKTNILTKNCNNLFEGINHKSLKTINFIISNLVNNYDRFIEVNAKMAPYVSKSGMERFKSFVNLKLKLLG